MGNLAALAFQSNLPESTTTHRELDADELKSAGVSEDLVRLSIGI
jgi:O-acetylhomoserine/O-acetylserine sulfhydrylase-like pyridoxal-dependent enzyme